MSARQSVQDAVATRQQSKPTLGQVVQSMIPEIQRALPRGMDGDRVARLALTVLRKDPGLAKCTAESFAGSLLGAAALGLEPGVNGEAYLVRYGDECTLIIGYQGYTKLFWQHPLAKHIDAQAVYENDAFDYGYGLDPFLTHKPAGGPRGAITHYYAVASLTTGARVFTVLTVDEVKALRGGRANQKQSIADPMHWMERKTAIRQLVKMLPKSTMLARAMDSDEKSGYELRQEQVAELAPANVDIATGVIDGTVISDSDETGGADPAADAVVDETGQQQWPDVAQTGD